MTLPATKPISAVSTIGKYRLQGKLGRGGGGTVYKSFDPVSGQPVAVKVLASNLHRNSKLQYRFAQEFQSASKLDHPNIVRAIDYGLDGNNVYLVMEYIEGESLGQVIDRDGRMPEDAAVRVIMQVAQGLHYAHRRKIIHRDVKPDNILVRADGLVKLTDFGLAKDLNNDRNMTNPASGLGTPHFMAPEQYENAKNAGPASDIYALAATLYTALTGTVPFDAVQSLLSLSKKLCGEAPSPRQVVPEISEHVDTIIRKALDPEPMKRPNTCLKFARALAGKSVFDGPRKSPGSVRVSAKLPDDRRTAARERRAHGVVCVVLNGSHSRKAEDNDEWLAIVKDVSNSGVGLLLARRFEIGTQMLVPLERQDGGSCDRWAEVVRVHSDRFGHWFHGCKLLTPLTDEELQKVQQR
jgi:serine/threonine protein kinase